MAFLIMLIAEKVDDDKHTVIWLSYVYREMAQELSSESLKTDIVNITSSWSSSLISEYDFLSAKSSRKLSAVSRVGFELQSWI